MEYLPKSSVEQDGIFILWLGLERHLEEYKMKVEEGFARVLKFMFLHFLSSMAYSALHVIDFLQCGSVAKGEI